MQPVQPSSGRGARLALVAVGLLVLLAIVAFASASSFGHSSRASPSPRYVSYAFTAFLIVFVLAIPFAIYAYLLQAREGGADRRKSFRSRVIQNLVMVVIFSVIAVVVVYIRRYHWHFLHIDLKRLNNPAKAIKHNHTAHGSSQYAPKFEWSVFWIAAALFSTAVVAGILQYRRRRRGRHAVPLDQSVTDDLVATIGDAIDDLEAETDARRAVIAAYARMEGVLGRHGLQRRPSETPLEYLRRVLLGVTSRGEPVTRLTALFEQAKFSRHEIDTGMKSEAIGALRQIRDDLQGVPA